MPIECGIADDLNVEWDPEASRIAQVFVARGRIEIILCESDPEWVQTALENASAVVPAIVIGCPKGRS